MRDSARSSMNAELYECGAEASVGYVYLVIKVLQLLGCVDVDSFWDLHWLDWRILAYMGSPVAGVGRHGECI